VAKKSHLRNRQRNGQGDIPSVWPTRIPPASGAGATIYAAELGIDCDYANYVERGSSVGTAYRYSRNFVEGPEADFTVGTVINAGTLLASHASALGTAPATAVFNIGAGGFTEDVIWQTATAGPLLIGTASGDGVLTAGGNKSLRTGANRQVQVIDLYSIGSGAHPR
jgi:hypothetical protein